MQEKAIGFILFTSSSYSLTSELFKFRQGKRSMHSSLFDLKKKKSLGLMHATIFHLEAKL